MTIKSKTITFDYVECGTSGHFLPGPEVTSYLRQSKFISALSEVAQGLSEYRIARPEAASRLHAALAFMPPEYRNVSVPPSLDQSLGFTNYGLIVRIAQDMSGTGPVPTHVSILIRSIQELQSVLGHFLIGAIRAPDANTEHANRLRDEAEEISKQHRAYKGVYA
ncbi:hypothetical protein [Variovorax paradoxus]|uniref:hypothetical protein n=1 Tax=Variovorax paradoxus TaxID=34073 RepID=UPI001ABCAC8D